MNKRFVGFLLSLFLGLYQNSNAQCDAPYRVQLYEPASIQVQTNIDYTGNGLDRQLMDIYNPPSSCNSTDIILLIHGGSFAAGDKSLMSNYGKFFAGYGIVAASINYRLAFQGFTDIYTSCDLMKYKNEDSSFYYDDACYMAYQDSRAALKFFKAYTENILGKKVERIYVMGVSAGAVTAVNLGFTDDEDVSKLRSDLIERNGEADSSTLPYLRDDTVEINSIFSISGTLSDLRYLTYSEKDINVDFFHAVNDPAVPFEVLYCNEHNKLVDGARRVYDQNLLQLSPACINVYYSLRGGHQIYEKFDRQIRDQILRSINSTVLERRQCGRYTNIIAGELFEPSDIGSNSEWGEDVELFPNPASTRAAFEFNYDYYTNDAELFVYNVNGSQVLHKTLAIYQGQNFERFDVIDFNEGVYIVMIRVEGVWIKRKLIVTKDEEYIFNPFEE